MRRTGFAGHGCAKALAQRKSAMKAASLALNAHLLDDRPELLDLALEDRVLLGGARAHRLRANFAQAPRRLRVPDRRGGLLLQPLDRIARRFRRRKEAVPAVRFQERKALLPHRRDVGKIRRTAAAVDRECLDLARRALGE